MAVVGVQWFCVLSDDSMCGDECVDFTLLKDKVRAVQGSKYSRKLRVVTWNFSGLVSEHKQKEVGEVLNKLSLDVVAGQKSWERDPL